ncbi:MAG TPA: YebC/PmpR family DNA-binding transcriptional regulator [Candidatus Paceibacterota bacterium]|nr:YebC/PmpR family DNA-binding transcriptional regulator [Candidatus Paceibacterota bacterium]
MAGHSKWAKLKHKKAITDARKSKVFSKLLRFISVEAKKAKGDRSSPGLRTAVDKARAANVPSENIDRAIDRASGESGELEPVSYEAYGPGGVALVIEGYTDSRNRTAQEIKHLLSTHGVALAQPGAASWAFQRVEGKLEPTTTVEINDEDGEKLVQLVDELEEHDDINEVYTNAA